MAQSVQRAILARVRCFIGWWLICALLVGVGACQRTTSVRTGETQGAAHTPPTRERRSGLEPSSSQLPVDADDGIWGEPLAPVTIVMFTDLQCPFCARGHEALTALERHYGEARLRVVVKHCPMSFHAGAVPAARVAQAVLALGGQRRFFEYLDRAFAQQQRIADGYALELVAPLGLDVSAVAERAGDPAIGQEVLRDTALADRLHVTGTPHQRINGLGVTGALPASYLAKLVDDELVAAQALLAQGVPAAEVYARRVQLNIAKPEAIP